MDFDRVECSVKLTRPNDALDAKPEGRTADFIRMSAGAKGGMGRTGWDGDKYTAMSFLLYSSKECVGVTA